MTLSVALLDLACSGGVMRDPAKRCGSAEAYVEEKATFLRPCELERTW